MNRDKTFREGYKAWKDEGENFFQNPYDEEEQSESHSQWADGWRLALKEMWAERIRRDCRKDRVKGIEVVDSGDDRVCSACAERDGIFFSAEEEIKDPPIPHEDCSSIYGYCRCVYTVVSENSLLDRLQDE